MAARKSDSCSKCSESLQLYLKALDEKRAGLLRLQEEQERTKKLRRQVEKLGEKLSVRRKDGCEDSTTKTMHAEKCLRGDQRERQEPACHEPRKCRQLQREADEAKQNLTEAGTRIAALESEVTRLATLIAAMHSSESSEHTDIVKQQLQVFQEDFSREREDRERVQSEKESLEMQVQRANEVIDALSQEIDMYKDEIKRNQEERRLLVSRRHSAPVPFPAEPQIQIVYPVVNPVQQQLWERQQERRRRQGILTRGGPAPPPPSAFLGGDVEVDH